MTKHLLRAGLALAFHGYKTGRDLGWYLSRRLQRA
jgi:hypothetical protein